jgi:hypothetical protein
MNIVFYNPDGAMYAYFLNSPLFFASPLVAEGTERI